MGQSQNGGDARKTAKTRASSSPTVLPDEELYLGLCWLSASTRQSFSPSRWLPSSSLSVEQGTRPHMARCFTVSSELVKPAVRKTHAFLVAHHVTVHYGLTVTGHNGVALATYTLAELAGKTKVQVGGVHIDVRGVESAPTTSDAHYATVLTFWRAEVEMDPPQYAVLKYTRHPVRAPPATETDRQQVGEGCLTGLRYGAYAVLVSSEPIDHGLRSALRARLPSDTEVVVAQGGADTPTKTGPSCTVSVQQASSTESAPLTLFTDLDKSTATDRLADWCAAAYGDPRCWTVASVFMQRYEAIGECLLKK